MPSLLKTLGASHQSKNAATIIRLTMHWPEIIGQELVDKSIPLKIGSRKQKNRMTGENEIISYVKIKAEGAFGTMIAMREAVIVERINRLFGTDNFRAIVIEHGTISPKHVNKPVPPKTNQASCRIDLPEIDDPVLKNTLESLGQAVKNRSLQSDKG